MTSFLSNGIGSHHSASCHSSQTFVDEVRDDSCAQQQPAVLLYAGGFDPIGQDIIRDFSKRAECLDGVNRVALAPEQVMQYTLPPLRGQSSDSRAARLRNRHMNR